MVFAPVPSAPPLLITSEPMLTLTLPAKVLDAFKISVPTPTLVRPPAPPLPMGLFDVAGVAPRVNRAGSGGWQGAGGHVSRGGSTVLQSAAVEGDGRAGAEIAKVGEINKSAVERQVAGKSIAAGQRQRARSALGQAAGGSIGPNRDGSGGGCRGELAAQQGHRGRGGVIHAGTRDENAGNRTGPVGDGDGRRIRAAAAGDLHDGRNDVARAASGDWNARDAVVGRRDQ